MKEHPKYSGYFVTQEGDVYRLPVKGERMPINEDGLVYLKPSFRGHAKYPEKQYYCVNISIRDENGKFVKQITKSNHQLVAETWVPNPHKHTEILHIDENPRNNHYTNLKWGTHKENMKFKHLPEGSIKIKNRNTIHSDGCKRNPTKYIKKNGEWVLIPSDRPHWKALPDGTVRTRKINGKYYGTFIKQNGKWVYQKKRLQ